MPAVTNTPPAYDTKQLSAADKHGQLALFLSPDGRNGSMQTHADAQVYAATLDRGQTISYTQNPSRKTWVQVIDGALDVNDTPLAKGDGLAIMGAGDLTFAKGQNAEFLVFDLAP